MYHTTCCRADESLCKTEQKQNGLLTLLHCRILYIHTYIRTYVCTVPNAMMQWKGLELGPLCRMLYRVSYAHNVCEWSMYCAYRNGSTKHILCVRTQAPHTQTLHCLLSCVPYRIVSLTSPGTMATLTGTRCRGDWACFQR